MNRHLLIALALVAALVVYVNGHGDDELLAAPKSGQGGRQRGHEKADQRHAEQRKNDDKRETIEPWAAASLIDGVMRWKQRGVAVGPGPSSTDTVIAWASNRPPPPPVPQIPAQVTPPAPPPAPPMAPRFPHAWVGRFNDEGVASVSGAASDAAPLARVVLTGPQSTWVVRAGDVIEGQWRIDRIQDRTLSLTYLPLQQQQTVVMR